MLAVRNMNQKYIYRLSLMHYELEQLVAVASTTAKSSAAQIGFLALTVSLKSSFTATSNELIAAVLNLHECRSVRHSAITIKLPSLSRWTCQTGLLKHGMASYKTYLEDLTCNKDAWVGEVLSRDVASVEKSS